MSLVQRFWLTLGVLLLVTVIVLAVFDEQLTAGVRPPERTQSPSVPFSGGNGLGDPYLPQAGGGGYDVQHYDVRVDARARELVGSATITAVATQDLDAFHLDLFPAVRGVTVNGAAASFTQRRDDLAVTVERTTPAAPAIASGSTFTATVEYAGDPGNFEVRGTSAFYADGKEFLIAGEPASASLWYPANDHPRDAATMQFTVTVPRGTEALAAGRLVERGADPALPDADRWVWQVDAPTVTYATFLAVGEYRVEQGTADGRPFVYAVSTRLSAERQTAALRWLRTTPAAVKKLEKLLGPYPFSGTGGMVPAFALRWAGLETAMNPVYHPRAAGRESLLNHELAHMWLGDSITLTEWNDLFNNESLTSYTEWLTTTSSDPARNFDRFYRERGKDPEFWTPPLSDPGPDGLFTRVYDRGPTAVHALRNRMGDATFFAFLREWAQQRGPRSLEDFRRAADDATPEDLTGFFAEWLDQTDRPEATTENGVPR